MAKKVIIDTDVGIDDAIALLLAYHSKELDILGITTTYGNVDVDQATDSALRLLEHKLHQDTPLYKGSSAPLVKERFISSETHGEDGLGNIHLPASTRVPEPIPAWEYLIQAARRYPNELTLVTLGPLTNIARAIQLDPEAMSLYKEIISMGGGVHIGNMSPVAEFNIWCDPEAAKIVYDFSIPVTMVGLNVTNKIILTPTDLKYIEFVGGEIGALLNQMYQHYLDYYWKADRIMGCVVHDALAVAVASDPTLVHTTYCNVEIAIDGITRGECVADLVDAWKKRKNCYVALDVDRERFRDRFFNDLFPHQESEYLFYKKFSERSGIMNI